MEKPLAALLVVLLAACGSTPPVVDAAPVPAAPKAAAPKPAPVAARPVLSALDDPASPLAKRSVYFPYDKFAVETKYSQLLNAHGSYLAHNPAAHITLEGNADERGSREYNLALGQKRAEAVRKSLSLLGVSDKQMEAISYGMERPKASCHDESCWQENRRTDIVYPASR